MEIFFFGHFRSLHTIANTWTEPKHCPKDQILRKNYGLVAYQVKYKEGKLSTKQWKNNKHWITVGDTVVIDDATNESNRNYNSIALLIS